jgi:hypothetical protein
MKKKAAPPPTPTPSLARRLGPAAIALIALTAGAVAFLLQQEPLKAAILDRHGGRLLPIESFRRPDPPDWLMGDRLGEELDQAVPRVVVDGHSFIDLSERELVRRIGRAAEKCGWLAEPTVRRGPKTLELAGVWRRPALYVPCGDRGFYIDGAGVVLPPDDVRPEFLRRQVLALEGLAATEAPAIGATLAAERSAEPELAGLKRSPREVERILAAADLARLLEPVRVRLGLVAIRARLDQAAGTDPSRFQLIAPRQAVIDWGTHRVGSPMAAGKLSRLEALAESIRRGEPLPTSLDLSPP